MFDSTDEAFISKISPSTACIWESESTKRIFKFSLKFKFTLTSPSVPGLTSVVNLSGVPVKL